MKGGDMKDTVRLIITRNCNRDCPDCCNKQTSVIDAAEHISDLASLQDYKVICITGGEPLLKTQRTIKIIQQLRKFNPRVTIFVYTAAYKNTKYNKYLITWVSGIHYTLHYPLAVGDMLHFYKFQTRITEYPRKSFRLYVDSRIDTPVMIKPYVWHRVEIKAWQKECPLPENEKLFIYEGE